MLLHGYHANGGCGLPGGDGDSGKKCGEAAETKCQTFLARRGLIRGKGKMVIFTVGSPSENVTNRKSLTRRRREWWFHLHRIYG